MLKEATTMFPTPNIPVPYRDIKALLKTSLSELMAQTEWYNLTHHNKLRSINDTVEPWNSSRKTRREELRLGHTRLTHSFIFEKKPPPICLLCNKLNTVDHILSECVLYCSARNRCSLSVNLRDILANNDDHIDRLMDFLSSTKLIKKL